MRLEHVEDPVDFLVPGLLGMNLMGTGIWSLAFSVTTARNRRILKRLIATPMPKGYYLLSQIFGRLGFLTACGIDEMDAADRHCLSICAAFALNLPVAAFERHVAANGSYTSARATSWPFPSRPPVINRRPSASNVSSWPGWNGGRRRPGP